MTEEIEVQIKSLDLNETTWSLFKSLGVKPAADVAQVIDSLAASLLANETIADDFRQHLIEYDKRELLRGIDAALEAGKPFTVETMAEVAREMGIEVEIAK
jgi:hypothetical protein